MKAVLLRPRGGEILVQEIPPPQLTRGHVLIHNQFSLLSAGTERARVQLGQQNVVSKARQRPDLARQLLHNVRQAGIADTYRLVSDRLAAPASVGYSCAGVAAAVAEGVSDVRVGSLVAAGGGGYARHAEVVAVPKNLCVPVPDGVPAKWAAFTPVGAIALQAIHQAQAEPGDRVAVIGLGLVGQLCVRLLSAYGFDVVGIDRDDAMVNLARTAGVRAVSRGTEDLIRKVHGPWNDAGADAILVAAATRSPDPVELAGQLARDRGTVVIVGDVNVSPPRSCYYKKELTIRYSRSYGPGRYDPTYEEGGVDYPEGFVPWPQRRNMAEFLRLVSRGMDLESLDPVVFPVEEAPQAYGLLEAEGDERRVAILLSYRPPVEADRVTAACAVTVSRAAPDSVRIAAVGAGSFPTRMLFPHLRRQRDVEFSWITSASGLTAQHQRERWGFSRAVGSLDEGLKGRDADCVMVLTRHADHARQAADVLRHGVGLFCEKPLALTEDELEEVTEAWLGSGAPAMVGFNRRFAPALTALKDALGSRSPIQVVYRVFAGRLGSDHWLQDPAEGGRLLGEVCHFIDTASFLTGSVPSRVHASSGDGCDDPVRTQSVSVQLEYQNGSTASIVYGGMTPAGAPKELIEVAADGVAGRVEDFRSVTTWSRRRRRLTFGGGPKGHAEEMRGLIDLVAGRAVPRADFIASLWTSLSTCRAVDSIREHRPVDIEAATPSLRKVLPTSAALFDGLPR